jgi:hypothetical protein
MGDAALDVYGSEQVEQDEVAATYVTRVAADPSGAVWLSRSRIPIDGSPPACSTPSPTLGLSLQLRRRLASLLLGRRTAARQPHTCLTSCGVVVGRPETQRCALQE